MAQADGLDNGLDVAADAAPLVGSAFGPVGMAVGGLAGMGLRAFSQWNRAKHANVPNRPIATTPQGIIDNQQNAQQVSSGALADATNTLAKQNIDQGVAQNINAAQNSARSSTDVMATLGNVNRNENNSLLGLAQGRYQQRLGGLNMLTNANNNAAGYSDRNFAYNQVEPYNQAYQNRQNLLTASNANADRAAQYAGQNAQGNAYLQAFAPGYTPSRGILDWGKGQQSTPSTAGNNFAPPLPDSNDQSNWANVE